MGVFTRQCVVFCSMIVTLLNSLFMCIGIPPGGVEVEVEVDITCPSWGPGGSYFWNITAGSEK